MADDHKLTLYRSTYGGWSVCACGWQSATYRDAWVAQSKWAHHLADVVRALEQQFHASTKVRDAEHAED